MPCPRCQADTPSDAEFCPECGARLAVVCAQCGTANLGRHKFCKKCGDPLAGPSAAAQFPSPASYTPKYLADRILTSRSALEGERKQVTVLFVDVSGFTTLSERLDPEEVHRLMTRAFELMLAEVHRYEGTVNQFLGDGPSRSTTRPKRPPPTWEAPSWLGRDSPSCAPRPSCTS